MQILAKNSNVQFGYTLHCTASFTWTVSRLVILLILICYFASPEAFGQNTLSPEPVSGEDNEELALDSSEIREQKTYALGLGIGQQEIWMRFIGWANIYVDSQWAVAISLGSMQNTYSGQHSAQDYELTQKATGTVGSVRNYFYSPFFAQVGVGVHSYRATSVPRGDHDISSSTKIGDFAAQMMLFSTAAQLGVEFVSKQSLVVELSIFGIGRAFVVSESFTRANGDSKDIVREKSQKPQSWGLLNLKLGYAF